MTEAAYNKLVIKNREHKVFNSDWEIYYSIDFADTLLPEIPLYRGKGLWTFDGAELFAGLQKTESRVLDIEGSSTLINLIAYTYPKDVKAAVRKQFVQATKSEVCLFAEVAQDDSIELSFTLGKRFKDYLQSLASEGVEAPTPADVESQTYPTTIADFKAFFGNQLVHEDLMRFVLETIGVETSYIDSEIFFNELEKELDALFPDFGTGRVRKKHPNSFAHGDIEDIALKKVGFNQHDIDKTYYGNWLRDLSQVIVGFTVGLDIGDYIELSKLKHNDRIRRLLPLMKCRPSQNAWVKAVEVVTVKEFIYNPKESKDKNIPQNYKVHLDDFVKNYGQLTKDVLGLYRPEEHLDNPKGLEDDSILGDFKLLDRPVNFQYEYALFKDRTTTLYAGENSKSLEIDEAKMMKRYLIEDIRLYEDDFDRPSSLTYLKEQLKLACQKGKNREGLRHFGAALHVLEDYFAHSNFVEICLIKNGYTDVFPWVQLETEIDNIRNGKEKASKIPVVTGLFDIDDTLASFLPKIRDEFFPVEISTYKSIQSGDKTFFDSLILALLEDLAARENKSVNLRPCIDFGIPGLSYSVLLRFYKAYLLYRDFKNLPKKIPGIGDAYEAIKKYAHFISQINGLFSELLWNILTIAFEEGIKSTQEVSNANFGTNPTHTQLAKDPPEHPLNPLAGILAIHAVEDIGRKMQGCWLGGIGIEELLIHIETTYFVHPKDTEWSDSIVRQWAKQNTSAVELAKSKTGHYHSEKYIIKPLNKFKDVLLKNPFFEW